MEKAPETYNGKHLVFEEKFRSPLVKDTVRGAERVLEHLREMYDSASGWVEIDAWIEPKDNGYIAVRHQAQYK